LVTIYTDRFNIYQFYIVVTLCLCALYGSQNKEQLLPYNNTNIFVFLTRGRQCLLRGTHRVLMWKGYFSSLNGSNCTTLATTTDIGFFKAPCMFLHKMTQNIHESSRVLMTRLMLILLLLRELMVACGKLGYFSAFCWSVSLRKCRHDERRNSMNSRNSGYIHMHKDCRKEICSLISEKSDCVLLTPTHKRVKQTQICKKKV